MKTLAFYKWIAGSMSDFTRPFQANDGLFQQARTFWNHLESTGWFIIITFIVIGILMAAWYYSDFNNSPGRHYKPKYWLLFLLATFLLTGLVTFLLQYIMCKPVLDRAMLLEFKIAIGNALYSLLVYTFISVVWCNSLPTNAYRLFKF